MELPALDNPKFSRSKTSSYLPRPIKTGYSKKTIPKASLSNASFLKNQSSLSANSSFSSNSALKTVQKRYSEVSLKPTKAQILEPPPQLPYTPVDTLHHFRFLLTEYEQSEIYHFNEIWFAGASNIQKISLKNLQVKADQVINHGYDDHRGDYNLTFHDHIAYRYEVISVLGKGSFGQCVKVYDHKTQSYSALKIIRNKKRFEKQGNIEVKILSRVADQDSNNIVKMLDWFVFRNHLCISFNLLGQNLYEWVRAGGFKGIHLGLVRVVARQTLKCLEFLNSVDIVHCDLKPENILFDDVDFLLPNRCDIGSRSRGITPVDFNENNPCYKITVIDFGSACLLDEKLYTYVQSRFYRSPEVILGSSYSCSIDMWSLGCILVELHIGFPLFPGENEAEQLACIMEVLGVPPKDIIEKSTRSKLFFDGLVPKIIPNSKGKKRRPSTRRLSDILFTADSSFSDFILKCLDWDPVKRLTPSDALIHPWINTSDNLQLCGMVGLESRMSRLSLLKKSASSSAATSSSQLNSVSSESSLPPISINSAGSSKSVKRGMVGVGNLNSSVKLSSGSLDKNKGK